MAQTAAKSRNLVPCPREVAVCRTFSESSDSIGNTPLLLLKRASAETGCSIYAKAEFMNPGGSIKDRIAKFIIEAAERRGALKAGSTILEVTSGNTGIALAMVAASKGYRAVLMMPKTVSEERRRMIQAFGAELELLEELLRMQAAVARSVERAKKDPTLFLPSQFSNPDNPLCHETTTGPEILTQTGGSPGRHGIQGLADGFIPEIVRLGEIDEVIRVKTEDAKAMARRLGPEEGLLVGISAGANVLAAKAVAGRLGPGRTIVTILPDRGERYLSLGPAA